MDEASTCIICLDGQPAPIQSGCGCRGEMGLAHVACRAEVAKRSGEWEDWHTCGTCGQTFTGAMFVGLAEEWVGSVAGLADEDEDRMAAEQTMANALMTQNKYVEAESILRKLVTIHRSVENMMNLASSLCGQKKHAEAEAILRESLARQRGVLGTDPPTDERALATTATLAGTLVRMGRYAEAEAMYRDLLRVYPNVDSFGRLVVVHNLARTLAAQRKLAEAEKLLWTTLPTVWRVLGDSHPFTVETHMVLATIGRMQV